MSNNFQSTLATAYDPSRARFAAMDADRFLRQAKINADQDALDLQEEAEDQAELDAMVVFVVASDMPADELPASVRAWLADSACNEGLTEIELIAFLKQNALTQQNCK